MAETIYYADKAVRITGAAATFGHRTYEIASISSVDFNVSPADKTRQWQTLNALSISTAGLGVVVLAVNWVLDSQLSGSERAVLQYGQIVLPILSLVLSSFKRARYLVTIQGTFGKADVVLARQWNYAYKVSKAIRKAIRDGAKTV